MQCECRQFSKLSELGCEQLADDVGSWEGGVVVVFFWEVGGQ